MSSWLVALIGITYFTIAVDSLIKGNIGIAIAFFGYSIGNIGLYIQVK